MSDLFQALSGGFAKFVYAWLMPSAVAVALFMVVVAPDLEKHTAWEVPGDGFSAEAAALVVTAVFVLSTVFAYASLPIYRVLEGYRLPGRLAYRLRKRRLRDWRRLNALIVLKEDLGLSTHEETERLSYYPDEEDLVLPTRLGNALRAMENYGDTRFGLDSQSHWYELQSLASDRLIQDTHDARAAVDFFISSVAHLTLLGLVALPVGVAIGSAQSLVLGFIVLALVPLAYLQAVKNVLEWRYVVQALVNLGRPSLATALGFRLPPTFEAERQLWESFSGLTQNGPHEEYLSVLDGWRLQTDASSTSSRSDRSSDSPA